MHAFRFLPALLVPLMLSCPAFAADVALPSSHSPVAAHLASYKTKATADKGWHILAASYSSVLYFTPAITEVDLPGKGHYFRLYAEGDADLLASLCTSMTSRKLYCVLHPKPH